MCFVLWIGIDLWKKYGFNITPEDVHKAILANKNYYLKLKGNEKVITWVNGQ